MAGFWIFICLLLICATIILGIFIVHAKPTYDAWSVNRRLDAIQQDIKKLLEEKKNHEVD